MGCTGIHKAIKTDITIWIPGYAGNSVRLGLDSAIKKGFRKKFTGIERNIYSSSIVAPTSGSLSFLPVPIRILLFAKQMIIT
jgi:hypothetical protein